MSQLHNPNCDGSHCTSQSGPVRLLPTGGDGNAILCHSCFEHELVWRRERNRELGADTQFRLPSWEELKVLASQESDTRPGGSRSRSKN